MGLNLTKKDISRIAVEASRVSADYPELGIKEAIDKAKEMVLSENYRETQRNISTTRY